MTELDRLKLEHEQAKRRVRDLERERSCRYAGWRLNDYHAARERCRATLARLEAAEKAEALVQPDGN